jgi:ATP-dependent DNA helicase 2 subunit 1
VFSNSIAEITQPDRFVTSKSGEGLTLLKSLVSNINSKQTPKRSYFSNIPFELGPGLQISVRGYNVFQKQAPARSCYVWLDGDKAQIAVSQTTRMNSDDDRTVEMGEVKKAYKFGGEYVYFSPEEQASVKAFGGRTIRIIGFKDRSLLKSWMSIKKSTFIFPSEEDYIGSTRVFSALWQKLLKSNKIGIAWHVARMNSNPVLVAVIPSRSKDDEESGTSYLPAGLWLYPIPFADDVRPVPDTKLVRTTDVLTDKMNKVVRVSISHI